MNSAKRGKIPPYSIFFLFYISRVVVTLTYIQTISVGIVCGDLLISIFLSFLLTIILSIPSYLCVKKRINPIDTKFIGLMYLVFFVYKASINIARFTGFSTSRLNPDSNSIFFAILISIAILYCTYLGIEGLSRFSLYAGVCIILAVIFIITLNIQNVKLINLYPIVNNGFENIMLNTLIMTSNSIESAMLLCLYPRINGSAKKAYFGSIFAEYLTVFLIIFVMLCVLGSNASMQAYPIFTLFQMATGNTLSRLDIVHTAFWVLAVFVKCSLLIYCATICIKEFSHKTKCVAFTVVALVLSLIITELLADQIIKFSKPFSILIYVIFCLLIPVGSLIINKTRKENIVEKSD